MKKVTDNAITVEWNPLKEENITFNVEIKESKSKLGWQLVNQKPISKNSVTAKSLKIGVEYVFRVYAVNAYGQGLPSEVSDAIKCIEKKGEH